MTAAEKKPPARRKRASGQRPTSERGRARRKTRSRWLLYGLPIALALLLILPVGGLLIWAISPGSGAGKGATTLRFDAGESPGSAAQKLEARGLIASPRLFAVYLNWMSPSVSVVPGAHRLRFGLTPRELVQRLGRLPTRARAQVNLPEGFTHFQIAERLEQREICDRRELEALARSPRMLAELALPTGSIEGYLFPATYDFFVDSDPAQILRQMVQETRKRLARVDARLGGVMARLASERGFREHEILTLASLVEKEARAREEQPLIASVFYNRLDDPTFRPLRMLQSDATAIYGCKVAPELATSCAGFNGKVTPEMLRDAGNPYNTYRRPGLPAGPIANPGESAIEAVLAPAKTDFLFFVADGKGRHRFSRTFEEHRRSIPR